MYIQTYEHIIRIDIIELKGAKPNKPGFSLITQKKIHTYQTKKQT